MKKRGLPLKKKSNVAANAHAFLHLRKGRYSEYVIHFQPFMLFLFHFFSYLSFTRKTLSTNGV